MRNAIVLTFLLGFTISLVPGIATAVSPPLNPIADIVDELHDFMTVEFKWDKSLDSEVEWYHLIYSCKQNCPSNPGDALWVIQPTGADPRYPLFVGGFDYSLPAAETRYQWRVGACSAQASGNCVYTAPEEFVTSRQPAPPANVATSSGGNGSGGTPAVLENPISSETLPQLLKNVLNFLFGLSIVILPIIILYGGFLMLTAAGDPTKISQSRTILLWAVVAFAIILLARGLPEVIRSLL
jgi:hypothetical protein